MGANQNIIEINGKKYNAVTGKILDSSQQHNHGNSRVKTVDGFAKNSNTKSQTLSPVSKSTEGITQPRTTPAHHKKRPQKSATLMRSSVKKPNPVVTAKPTQVAGISKPTLRPSKMRRHLASKVSRSEMISHYGSSASTSTSSAPKAHQEKPVVNSTKQQPAQNTQAPKPSVAHHQGASKTVETALANATAHDNPHHNKKKRGKLTRKLGVSARAMAISSTVLAGVLLGGFFAIQNVPNLSMRVASARAGFNATLPGYNPSGFSFAGPINYNPGQVTISYRSNTDDRSYDVTQRASNWNSEALLSNFVATNSEPYQTYQDRGRTLYIYEDSNATWVDNGVWYQIEGNSQMTSDQLVRIAASM